MVIRCRLALLLAEIFSHGHTPPILLLLTLQGEVVADEKDLAGLSASFFPELPVVLRPHTRYEPFDGLIIMA